MKQIRSILTLHLHNPTASIRYLSRASGCSRPVVAQYCALLTSHPLPLSELEKLDDSGLREHLGLTQPPVLATDVNQTLIEWLHANLHRLNHVGMTRRLLHEDYRRDHPDGLAYSQFCFILKQSFQGPEASALLDHKAGDALYLDFTGHKVHWQDLDAHTYIEEIFVAVLGASGAFFALPIPSQTQEDFAYATDRALQTFGAVPRMLVPDCLKSAVIHTDGFETEPNPLFARLAAHYSTICLPARPHHPRDKALVEGAVKLVYRQILARMETLRFPDRPAFLAWWLAQVERINTEPFQKLPGSRRSRFEAIDLPAMRPLPDSPFTLQKILSQTVEASGCIYVPDDRTYYSVPHSLLASTVEILLTPDHLEVWADHCLRASHARQPQAGKVILPEHLDHAHRWYASRNPDDQLRVLREAGQHIGSWASRVIDQAHHPDEAWRRLLGLQRLLRQYPSRLDTVCRIALSRNLSRLADLKHLLASQEDLALLRTEALSPEFDLGNHPNIRGSHYYAPPKEAVS